MIHSKTYWTEYQSHRVLKNSRDLRVVKAKIRRREETNTKERDEYIDDYPDNRSTTANKMYAATVKKLREWTTLHSWSFCPQCHLLHRCTMQPALKSKTIKLPESCSCTGGKYVVPRVEDFAEGMTEDDQDVLRLYRMDVGPYHREKNGYRQRTRPCRLVVVEPSVEDRINDAPEERRDLLALKFGELMELQSYRDMYHQCEQRLESDEVAIPWYELFKMRHVEIGVWPLLYVREEWCESAMVGGGERLSAKRSFLHKLLSEVLDFGQSFELLQFHYDRWIYKTVCSAVEVGKTYHCTPKQSLENKVFTSSYWQWQHSYLQDALRQFGYPSLFITFSPGEWNFPKAAWLSSRQELVSDNIQQLPVEITIHIMHVLEQYSRGYVTGGNCNRWKSHVCADTRAPLNGNVLIYFYRFEFQKRGTPHVHMLVWLKSSKNLHAKRFRADRPRDNANLSYDVTKLQSADVANHSIALREEESDFGSNSIAFKYTAEDAAHKRRAYIDTVMSSLECRMDVQCTDGKSLLLQYVTSYVTKLRDHAILYDSLMQNVSGVHVGTKYMRTLSVNEPEMIQQFASIKPATCSALSKKYRVPWLNRAATDKAVIAYLGRPHGHEQQSLLEFLRCNREDKGHYKPYKVKTAVLVGLKYVSFFNPMYFFQHSLMNVPFVNIESLLDEQASVMHDTLKYFAGAMSCNEKFWSDEEAIKEALNLEGHRQVYIRDCLSYVESLRVTLRLVRGGMIDRTALRSNEKKTIDIQSLSTSQLRAYVYAARVIEGVVEKQPDDGDRLMLIDGEAGSGKSYVVQAIIDLCMEKDLEVAIACPTAKLASSYAEKNPDIRCDTVNGTFNIPVATDVHPNINWGLTGVGLIIVDEITQVSERNIGHILMTRNSLPYSPVLIFCGDKYQLQPLDTNAEGKTVIGSSFFKSPLIANFAKYSMTLQLRCTVKYRDLLVNFRSSKPTVRQVGVLNSTALYELRDNDTVLAEGMIEHHLSQNPKTLFLTLTLAMEEKINEIAAQYFFSSAKSGKFTIVGHRQQELTVYIGQRMYITENRCKRSRYVNGMTGTVMYFEKSIVYLKAGSAVIPVFPVYKEHTQYYPLKGAYASTVHRVQGQTLDHATLVFDRSNITPGVGYVAISRVKDLTCLSTVFKLVPSHFRPVE